MLAGLAVVAVLLIAAPGATAAVEQAAAIDVAATAGEPFSGPVASFRSTTPGPEQFTATISWGDGSPSSAGTITAAGSDPNTELTTYRVDGTHTYGAAGSFPTAIEIAQPELYYLPPTVVNGTATIAAAGTPAPPPPAPPPPPGQPPPAGQPPPPPLLAPALIAPTIQSLAFSPPPRAGRRSVLRITAVSENAPIGGYVVDLGEPGGRIRASACTLLPVEPGDGANPFEPGTPTTFGLPYTFRRAGDHHVEVAVSTGFCTGNVTTNTTLDVPVAGTAAASAASSGWPTIGALTARVAQAACTDAETLPAGAGLEAVATAAVCLHNVERARAGVPELAVDGRLLSSAAGHGNAMLKGHFFSHQGPSEPDLGARVAQVGYRAVAGENIYQATARLATASAALVAWMNSPPHRKNILDARFHGIGISVLLDGTTAWYTANFGTDAASGAAPAEASAPVPAIKLAVAPRAFRAAASGPPAAASGPGTRVSYVLTRPASVTFSVRRKLAGRRAGRGRCVSPKRAKRTARRCVRTQPAGAFTVQGSAGANVVRFSGRIRGRRLPPGSYILVAVATDATRRASNPISVSFRILAGRT